jgi:hypothetical protein
MTDLTDNELLVELRAKRDWLRTNPSGMAAATAKRKIKEIERELESRRIAVEASPQSQRSMLGLSVWYVVDVKETVASRSLHADRACTHLNESKIREATDYEREHLAICSS